MAAIAVLAGTLAFGQVPATAAPVPAEGFAKVEAKASVVLATPRAPGPLDVLGALKGLYDKYETCRANQAVGQPCGASDSDNIRKALETLQGLDENVKELQKSLDRRFTDLALDLSKDRLDRYRSSLVQIDENVPHAIGAFRALVDCQAAKLDGKADCLTFSLTDRGQSTSVDDGIDFNRDAFLTYTSRLPDDLTGTIARYAGTSRASKDSDVNFARIMWRFAKLKVEINAGASEPVFTKSDYAPFVTPSMAAEVNTYLEYYGDLLASYAEVLWLRQVILRDQAEQEGDTKAAKRAQNTADLIRNEIAGKINSTDANSVAGVNAMYRLTPLQQGDIIMASDNGVGAMVFETGGRYVAGARAMFDTDVAALGQGLRLYGNYSRLKERERQAFPQGSDWYAVKAKRVNLLCDSDAIRGERGRFTANWLPSVIAPSDRKRYDVTTQTTRVKLLDNPPKWSDVSESGKPDATVAPDQPAKKCGDGRGKDYTVNVWKWESYRKAAFEATELRFPMTYDWDKNTYWITILGIASRDYGIGEGASIKTFDGPLDSLLIDVGANRMVRWPDNFDPTGMPDSYGR